MLVHACCAVIDSVTVSMEDVTKIGGDEIQLVSRSVYI